MTSLTGKSPRPNRRQRDPSAGFTLIELLFVMGLMALLMGVSYPLYSRTYRRIAHEEAAQRLVHMMAYARHRAVMEGRPYRVVLDESQGACWIDVQRESLGRKTFERLEGSWGRSFQVPEGMAMRADTASISFYPNGTSTDAAIEMSRGSGERLRVQTDPVLGIARVTDEST